ncbi:MAG: hypothetical protein ABI954_09250 [Pyrinomonadaceae bacterium]
MFAKKMFALLFAGALCLGTWQFVPYLLDMRTVLAQSKPANTAEASLNNSAEKPEEAKKDDVSPEVKEKAIKLLTAVAQETQQFAAPQNRVRGQIAAANLLWEHDEPAARVLFQNTLSELQAMLGDLATSVSDDESNTESENYTKRYAVGEMRREYLLALAAHDPKAALVALQSLRLQTPSKQEYDPLKADELELQIASTVAKKDPQQAYELAAKSLKDGVTYNTMSTLTDLYKNNAELGAKLARDILAKFKASKIRPMVSGNSNIATTVSVSPNGGSGTTDFVDLSQLAQFMTTTEQLNRQASRSKGKKIPALTDSEMRELADFIGQGFTRQQNVEPWAIASAMPLITKYSPTAAQLIKRKLNAQQLQMLGSYGDGSNYYEEKDTKTVDELVADADKLASPSERDSRYADAVHQALEKGELEKAAEIGNKIKDKTSYQYIFEELKTTTPLIKARRGDIAEVRKLLASMKDDDQKAATLTELVIALVSKGEKETAEKLMDEANQFLPARLKRKPNLETTLKIGSAYALVQPARGFGLIENSIAQMNDLIAAGLMIDEFYDYGTMDSDEVLFDTMERQGVLHTTNAVATIKILAAVDFDRTVNLADKFARPEIRTYVRLKIAEALLDPEAAGREKTLREQQSEREGD